MRNIIERTLLGEQNDIKFVGINGPERLQLEAQKQKKLLRIGWTIYFIIKDRNWTRKSK